MEFDKIKYAKSLTKEQIIDMIAYYEIYNKEYLTEEQKEYLNILKEIIKNK